MEKEVVQSFDSMVVKNEIPRGVYPERQMRFFASLRMTKGEGPGMTFSSSVIARRSRSNLLFWASMNH